MDILKDIEKNFLNINIYSKNADNAKINIIKKQIDDYFKYKHDDNNKIMEKKIKYEDKYKRPRELNNSNYEYFLEKKEHLYNIYKETKSLSALYDYLNCKIVNYTDIPEIYTYEYQHIDEQNKKDPVNTKAKKDILNVKDKKNPLNTNDKKVPVNANPVVKAKVCPPGKVLNPVTNRCVKDPANKDKDKNDTPNANAVGKAKICPPGKVLNPVTNRCIKDVNYKPK